MSDNKTDVLSELTPEEQTPKAKKARQAQADQMYGNAKFHAPAVPTRADMDENGNIPSGAPPAQGMNLSKEEGEFAANALANKQANDLPDEKIPASQP